MAKKSQPVSAQFGPFRPNLHDVAAAINSLHERPDGEDKVPKLTVLTKRLKRAFSNFDMALPDGSNVRVKIDVPLKRKDPTPPQMRRMHDLVRFLDAIAFEIDEVDYFFIEKADQMRLAKALRGLTDTMLSGTDITVTAKVDNSKQEIGSAI